jgi:cobalt-precorrin 5A hydrolase
MATGIVVRLIAPFLQHKYTDPAVVVMDERGRHAISLVSGHLGGANVLTRLVADIAGATPVITTATDVNELPAIDVLAQRRMLHIETPAAVARVNMAIIHGDPIWLFDPCNHLNPEAAADGMEFPHLQRTETAADLAPASQAAVCIDYRVWGLPDHVLVLRPKVLSVGIGCNRDTPPKEIKAAVERVFMDRGLSLHSIAALSSIDIKRDEKGLLQVASELGLSLDFFSKSDLDGVAGIATPSEVVAKHVGVKSVCEAAAILSARGGELIVTKQRTPNVTVAVACRPSLSSA